MLNWNIWLSENIRNVKKRLKTAFSEAELSAWVPKAAFAWVWNSFGPIQSLNPAAFFEATRIKYVVFCDKLFIK